MNCAATILLLAALALCVQGVSVSKAATIRASTDGCGTAFCDPLTPTIPFTPADFGCAEAVEPTAVVVAVTFRKTHGSCTGPEPGNAYHEQTSYLLQEVGFNDVRLIDPSTYSGGADISDVTVVFDQLAATTPSGTPTSGTFRPTGGNLDDLTGRVDVAFEYQLVAGDSSPGEPLCTRGFIITVSAECRPLPPIPFGVTKTVSMTDSTDGCGTFCDDLSPTITFQAADFGCLGSFTIDAVTTTVAFQKTSGSCASPDTGDAHHDQISYRLDSDTSGGPNVVLVNAGDYSGNTAISDVEIQFRQDVSPRVSGVPTSGYFQPASTLDAFVGYSGTSIEFQLVAGDNGADAPLCTKSLSVRARATCDGTVVTSCEAMSGGTDGCGNFCDPLLPVLSFPMASFGCASIMEISNVEPSVTFVSSGLTCSKPAGGFPTHLDINYALDFTPNNRRVPLVEVRTYSGNTIMSRAVTVTFSDGAASTPSGTPTSGTFLPAGSLADVDGLYTSDVTLQLVAGDVIPGDPLCTRQFCASVSGACVVLPTIACPASITSGSTTGQCGAIVSYHVEATPADQLEQTTGHASGTVFPIGTTTNSFTASRGYFTETCSFDVTVSDTEDPVFTSCPEAVFFVEGTAATYTVTSTDNCSGHTQALVSGPPSGSTLPAGTHPVVWRAADTAGNTATCSFDLVSGVPFSFLTGAGGDSLDVLYMYLPFSMEISTTLLGLQGTDTRMVLELTGLTVPAYFRSEEVTISDTARFGGLFGVQPDNMRATLVFLPSMRTFEASESIRVCASPYTCT